MADRAGLALAAVLSLAVLSGAPPAAAQASPCVPAGCVFGMTGKDAADIRVSVRILRSAPATNVLTIQSARRREPSKSVAFRFVYEGLPTDKTYRLWQQDEGMAAEGLPPVPIPSEAHRFRVDAQGRWTPELPAFHVVNWARGEWIQLEVRSTDGAVSRTVRFTPFK